MLKWPLIISYPIFDSPISRIEDLEGKSKEEIWLIICSLVNQNAALALIVNQLNDYIAQRDADINIYRELLSDIAALKAEVRRLIDENTELKERVQRLEQEFALLKVGLSAREIGVRADTAAMRYVFPNVTQKPYSIRSLINLSQFIENPEEATAECLCAPNASVSWSVMEDGEKHRIKSRLQELLGQYPGLIHAIETLKDDWQGPHNATSVAAIIEYFQTIDDDTMVDALELCYKVSLIADNQPIARPERSTAESTLNGACTSQDLLSGVSGVSAMEYDLCD